MALGLEDKKAIVAEVNETAARALSVVIADARGVSVANLTTLRKQSREANVHVLTHSLHYGLSVFEGVRAYKTASGPATISTHPAVISAAAPVAVLGIQATVCNCSASVSASSIAIS